MTKLSLKVAIQGDRASFHEIAAQRYYQESVELLYCQTFEETFALLHSGGADRAFVAVSNTAHGTITEVAKLINVHPVKTEGTHDLPIEQHLIGTSSANLGTIQRVVSHPVALSQCSIYLSERLAHSQKTEYHDTSAAVEYIKTLNSPGVAAIGSEAAATLHGMRIIKRAIQDDPNNVTTFQSFVRQ